MRSAVAFAVASVFLVLHSSLVAQAQTAGFAAKPQATRAGEKVKITFSLSGPSDVEVAVVDAGGKVVRHLAAGVLGAKNPPPAPLKPGLAQAIEWDGKDDFGKAAGAAPFTVRVRAGTGVKFGQLIGANPYNFGRLSSSAVDEDGNIYVMGFNGQLNQGQMNLRMFDKQGNYVREILPFPANLPKDSMPGVAKWDEEAKAFRPINYHNQNVDFYNEPVSGREHSALKLVSASKTKGIVLSAKGRTIVLSPTGAVLGKEGAAGGEAGKADISAFLAAQEKFAPKGIKYTGPGEQAIDWNRMAVDYARDEVYINDGSCYTWRYDGKTGKGGLLRRNGKPFLSADEAVGYDGTIYFRLCNGSTPGGEFTGPFERFTRDLEPANLPSGSNVLSPTIYGRYGVGYAERGIGVGPDGTSYITILCGWVKYCTIGFTPEGKAIKGKYLEGQVGGKGRDGKFYPPELNSAVFGLITAGNGGIRVDLAGNIYMGLWAWPKGVAEPAAFAKDPAYLACTGSVFKFTKAGGRMTSPKADWGSDTLTSEPPTPGMPGMEARSGFRDPPRPASANSVYVEGAIAAYPGYGPFSHCSWSGNSCCVCRAPRFDLDRYGRLIMPNAITNTVQIVDNNGNLVLEFGKYGNFDSQYVPAGAAGGKPVITTPEIPLGWPTCAGVTEKSVYVLDTYARRVVRADLTWKAEETCAVK